MANSAEEANRILKLNKKREKALGDIEIQKKRLAEEAKVKVGSISDKFDSHVDVVEKEVRDATVGLMTLEQIREKKAQIEKEHARIAKKKAKLEKKKKKKKKGSLSFDMDDGNAEDGSGGVADGTSPPPKKIKKTLKNPDVDTSFLPDRDREAQEAAEREALKQEWLKDQQVIKDQEIDVTYSYWDGAGHRRTTRVTKGTTIEGLLATVQREFHELRGVGVEGLMFIKEDLIIPHHYSFYDLIVTKARGKSGPLFYWDVREDVRTVSDATVEKEESHAAKVCERRWYERNKHIFPASRWEVYDPTVKRDKYTIHGGEVQT